MLGPLLRRPILDVRIFAASADALLQPIDDVVLILGRGRQALKLFEREFIFSPSALQPSGVIADEVLAIAFDDFQPLLRQAAIDAVLHVTPNVRGKGRPQVGEARLWTSP
jgi:hypothetical protein